MPERGGLKVAAGPDHLRKPGITSEAERWAHFSAHDHVRYYGLDFAGRWTEAGFHVETFRVSPEDEVTYALLRDEWLYVALKP
jgi:hypothetical protein